MCPKEIYGSMKLASEYIVLGYSQMHDIKINIVRPSAVYGPTDMNYRIVQKVIENSIDNIPVTLNNPENNYLDFTYVNDVCDAIKCVTLADTKSQEIFNVTHGNARSLKELGKIINTHYPSQKFIINQDNSFYPKRGTLDISKTKELTGYKPNYPLEKGIAEYKDFYDNYII